MLIQQHWSCCGTSCMFEDFPGARLYTFGRSMKQELIVCRCERRASCQGAGCCGTIWWWSLEWRARCQALRHLCVLSCRAPPVPETDNFHRQLDFFIYASLAPQAASPGHDRCAEKPSKRPCSGLGCQLCWCLGFWRRAMPITVVFILVGERTALAAF